MPLVGLNGLDANGQRVQNVATPTVTTDAATKGYVDAYAGGGGGSSSDPLLMPTGLGSPMLVTAPNMITSRGGMSATKGVIYATPFYVGASRKLTKIAWHVDDPPGSGSFTRLGLCSNLSGQFAPGAFLLDTGQINTNVAYTDVTAVLGSPLTLAANLYWVCLKVEGSPANIKIYGVNGDKIVLPYSADPTQLATLLQRNVPVAWASNTVADGAFPSTFPMSGATALQASTVASSTPFLALQLETP